jgi:hypothetical protein
MISWRDSGITPSGLHYRIGVRRRVVPRVPDGFLDSSVYLYSSVQAAKGGERSGGCGFLAHVPSEQHQERIHLYAVTNKHVIENGCRVLRLNTTDGAMDTLKTVPEAWTNHPDGDDLAVTPIEPVDKKFKWSSVSTYDFVTTEVIRNFGIGIGDEVFLIGRLVTAAGRQKNTPAARFGNLSMMSDPKEPIVLEGGQEQEGFLVECRSLSGFSGSPVFVQGIRSYLGQDIPERWKPPWLPSQASNPIAHMTGLIMSPKEGTFGPWLLGIDCAHVPLWRPVYENDRKTRTQQGYHIDANTGIACVIPAWRILELLNDKELVRARRRDDTEIAKRKRDGAVLDG